jgi:hypothetical protein
VSQPAREEVKAATLRACRPERHPNRQPLTLTADKIPRPEELMAKEAGAGKE